MIKIILFTFFILFTKAQQEGCLIYKEISEQEQECTYCKSGYGYNSQNKSCSICPEGTYSLGGTATCDYCYNYKYCKNIQNENERKT